MIKRLAKWLKTFLFPEPAKCWQCGHVYRQFRFRCERCGAYTFPAPKPVNSNGNGGHQ